MVTGDAIYAIGRRQLADEARGPFTVCHLRRASRHLRPQRYGIQTHGLS